MTRVTIPWPIRSVVGGTAGTATMTLAYETERRRAGRRARRSRCRAWGAPGRAVLGLSSTRGGGGHGDEAA